MSAPDQPQHELSPAEVMDLLSATWSPDAMGQPRTVAAQVDLFSPDVVVIEPATLPHGGRHAGIGAYRELQARMGELWQQTIESAEYWPCAPDRFTLRIVITWRSRATGKTVTLPMIDMIRFEGGQIVEVEAFLSDTAALLATLEGQ